MCPSSCLIRNYAHTHDRQGRLTSITVGPFRFGGDPMTDDPLPPLTWDSAHALASVVHAAQKLIDLDIRPIRVWKLTAHCSEHNRDIEEERDMDFAQTPNTSQTLTCPLCACRKWSSGQVKVYKVSLVRG